MQDRPPNPCIFGHEKRGEITPITIVGPPCGDIGLFGFLRYFPYRLEKASSISSMDMLCPFGLRYIDEENISELVIADRLSRLFSGFGGNLRKFGPKS